LAGALGGHRHCLSGGTAIPRAVPTRPRLRAAVGDVVTTVTGVHRRSEGGALPGHRRWEGCATTVFQPRARKSGLVTAWASPCLGRCTTLFFQRMGTSCSWQGVTATPMLVHCPCCLVTLAIGIRPLGRALPCPMPSQKVQLCSNGPIWLRGYK
jgi:hypothetical protein